MRRVSRVLGVAALVVAALSITAGGAAADVGDGALVLAQEEGASLGGTLRDSEGEPVQGVQITVRTADGEEVGTAETDAEGAWQVAVPGPGSYEAELDAETLPEGVDLRDPDRNPLQVDVRPDRQRLVIFALGEGEGGSVLLSSLAQSTVDGVKIGLIIAMTAIGLSLIFGTTGLINFAHGELVTFGAITAWFLNRGALGLHLLIAAPIAIAVGGAAGAALERGLFLPLRRRRVGLFQLLVITIGLSLLLQNLLLIWFGGQPQPYGNFVGQSVVDIGPFSVTPRDMWVMGLSVLILVGVATMLQTTRIGKAMRAVADNKDLAESSGIDVQRVILIVWILGVGLAATGGVFTGLVVAVDFLMGFRLLLLMFAGVILGGLGTAYGAMVGSLIVGLVTEISTVWFPSELKVAWALAVLIVVLLIRPQGILGRKERIG